ncbi:MAG: ABC transporter ATP-binding protein [Longimicrobiales bacterium]
MASVRLERVRKVYGGTHAQVAVEDLSVAVADGEFVVIVGPSGCGKSTTLRMIAGLESVSGGQIHIGDRLVNDVRPRDRDIAMVFQNYALYPHMSVYENMAFGLKLRKLNRAEIGARVSAAAATLGLEPLLQRKPRELSGGQRQRVALGRAIVRQPQVFLFDEPLSNLDAKLRVQMRAELSRLHRELRATMVYVTHDQVEAMTMGQRIVVLHDGRLQQYDTPMELYQRPANRFVAGFIGSPAMNFIEGSLERRGNARVLVSADGEIHLPLPLGAPPDLATRRRITAGIRPESLDVAPAAHTRPAASAAAGAAARGRVSLDASIELVEPMGNELFVYLRLGRHRLVARVPPRSLPPIGEQVHVLLDADQIHLFDGESGAALAHARVRERA